MKHIKHNLLPLITLASALLMAPKTVVASDVYLPIKNNTPYWASVGVHYPRCKDDHTVIAPGDRVRVNTKECTVSRVEGVLATVIGDSSKNIVIQGELINPDLGGAHWGGPHNEYNDITIDATANGGYRFNHRPVSW